MKIVHILGLLYCVGVSSGFEIENTLFIGTLANHNPTGWKRGSDCKN